MQKKKRINGLGRISFSADGGDEVIKILELVGVAANTLTGNSSALMMFHTPGR